MAESFIPDELTFQTQMQPENCIQSKVECSYLSPTAAFTAAGNNIITMNLVSGDGFVQMDSIELWMNIAGNLVTQGGATTVNSGVANTQVVVNSTMSLFSDITLSTVSGVVLESIQHGVTFGQLLTNLSYNPNYTDTVGTVGNMNSQPFNRECYAANNPLTGSPQPYRLEICKVLGFFSDTHKYLRLKDFGGGLVLSLTMAPTAATSCVRNAGTDSYALTMTNARLTWLQATVTDSYMEYYTEQFLQNGFRLMFNSVSAQAITVATLANQTIPLSVNYKRVKAIVCTLRDNALQSAVYPATAFLSSGLQSYAFQINGQVLPPQQITSYFRACNEAERIIYARPEILRQNGWTMAEFCTDVVVPNQAQNLGQWQNGKLMMSYDFEKYSSSQESGIALTPGATNLLLNFVPNGASANSNNYNVYAFYFHQRAVTVVGGEVTVTF